MTQPVLTPTFFDAAWMDVWPRVTDVPSANLDLTLGDANSIPNGIDRLLVARHPLMRGAKTVYGQPIPGTVDMGFVDGHVSKLRLQDLKTVYWHRDWTPTANPWRTAP